MSKKLYEESSISAIADAIRNKNGSSDSYKVSQMASAISQIAPAPLLQTKTATSNGIVLPDSGYDGLNQVIVQVPGSAPVLQEKTVTQNGIVLPDSGYDGLSKVTVNVSGGGGGSSGVYVGTTDPDSSIGSNGDYYYKRLNKFDAIQNRDSLSSASGSQTFVYGIEFYVTVDCAITKLRGFTTEARTGKLRIGTTSNILAEKTCSFEARNWTEVTLDTPVLLTRNNHYIIQVAIDNSFSTGVIGYTNSVYSINYNSVVRYAKSRYGSFPGSVEQNSGVLVDFTIERDYYICVNQYYKENGTWVQID